MTTSNMHGAAVKGRGYCDDAPRSLYYRALKN